LILAELGGLSPGQLIPFRVPLSLLNVSPGPISRKASACYTGGIWGKPGWGELCRKLRAKPVPPESLLCNLPATCFFVLGKQLSLTGPQIPTLKPSRGFEQVQNMKPAAKHDLRAGNSSPWKPEALPPANSPIGPPPPKPPGMVPRMKPAPMPPRGTTLPGLP